MHDQNLTRILICAGSGVIGLVLLAYTAWARAGASPRARHWMGNEFGAFTRDERFVLLGAPALGVICLCICAATAPGIGRYLVWAAVPIAVLAFLPMLWAMMTFIPIPAFLYPRWARPLRERNIRADRGMKAWLRGR